MSGTPRPAIVAAQPGPGDAPPRALTEARESSLFSDPGWLRATDHAIAAATPFHTIARRRADEYAILPAYRVEAPDGHDAPTLTASIDPRTYLGDATASTAPTDLSAADLLPAVVIGSPLGRRTEPFFTFWNERLLPDMISATLDAARAAGARIVVAPWAGDRLTGLDVAGELASAGAATVRSGTDDHVLLTDEPAATGQLDADHHHRMLGRTGPAGLPDAVTIRTLTGPELLGHLPALAELTSQRRPQHDAAPDPATIHRVCGELAEHNAVYAACAFTTGAATDPGDGPGRLVAGHILVHRHPRLYGLWYGRERGGTHTGLDAALLSALPRELGRRLGARHLELGANPSAAGHVPGTRPRTRTTAFLAFDDDVQRRCVPLLAAFGRSRRTPDHAPTAGPLLPLTVAASSGTGRPD